ncbi:branched-chain amino acid transport system II carrier protein [Peptoniphilus sp. KCTC 25270]|uniref:branched-chain amino acid transport system II carrier protein n=1 Tax=Peptoniphilus sp. KCTC 25270 TaxID=2897414 RepID=UPI001E569F11|nr:branched-chain amino acid transport system II carrier protein [Peptoniphilus sp. KCTC 25270]MCD1147458.1 branched-chain amino acid transport system II carrier protein [Peptoniphilus sp. KCTC 25270]
MENHSFRTDTLIIGFTLFATFFGAGNLVFPPFMGMQVGAGWILGIIGLVLTGILLPILSMIGVVKGGGSLQKLTEPISRNFYIGFNVLTMYLIATLILVPRTGATTYEVGFLPHFPGLPSIVVQIVFFGLTYILTIDKEGVVDKIGKYLTPALIVIVLFIIGNGLLKPQGAVAQPVVEAPFQWAFVQGYQMGDLVTGLLFSTVLMATIKQKGYNKRQGGQMTIYASLIAFVLLLIIYGSLLRVGATTSSVLPVDMPRTALLTTIVNRLLGNTGGIVLSIAVSLACLTTSVGITTSVANFTMDLTRNKIPYKLVVAALCIFCAIQGAIGVEKIIGLSEPFFAIAYPLGIIITTKGLTSKFLTNLGAWKGATLCTVVYTIFHALSMVGFGGEIVQTIVNIVPLGAAGFGWIPVAIIGFIGGSLLIQTSKESNVVEY